MLTLTSVGRYPTSGIGCWTKYQHLRGYLPNPPVLLSLKLTLLAVVAGIEPTLRESKSRALPLGYTTI